MWHKNKALPPLSVPVSMITLGRMRTRSSWYIQRSDGSFSTRTPIQ